MRHQTTHRKLAPAEYRRLLELIFNPHTSPAPVVTGATAEREARPQEPRTGATPGGGAAPRRLSAPVRAAEAGEVAR